MHLDAPPSGCYHVGRWDLRSTSAVRLCTDGGIDTPRPVPDMFEECFIMQKLTGQTLSRHVEEKGDVYLLLFVCCYLVFQAFNQFLHYAGLRGMVWIALSRGILAVLALLAGSVVLKRKAIIALVFEGAFVLLVLCTYFWGSPYPDYRSMAFDLLVVYIPMGLAFYCTESVSLALDVLYISSWIIEIICIVTSVLALSSRYSVTLGSCLLLPILIKLDRFSVSRRWYDLLMALLDMMALVFGGGRGPFVCIVVFLLILLLTRDTVSVKKRLSILVLLLVLAALLYVLYPYFAAAAAPLIDHFHIRSRTLRMLLSGNISFDSGRSIVWNYFLEKIRLSPLLGYGITGAWELDVPGAENAYPHSIVLELVAAFGIPIGALLTLALGAVIIRGLRQKNPGKRRLAIIFLSFHVHLLWAGSFLKTPLFFVALAACLRPESKKEELSAAPPEE